MGETDERRTLLGRLAGVGWFSRQGEVAATTALAFMLEDEPLRAAFLRHLGTRTDTDVTGVTEFIPEAFQEDRARPDLEGRDKGFPLIKVEAKFAESMSREQFLSFQEDQTARLATGGSGVLVALVPAHRKPEAEEIVGSLPSTSGSPVEVATHVMTWDELLDVLDSAASDAGDLSVPIRADLLQLRDLFKTFEGLDIRPFGDAARGRGWEERQADLQRIVERVTERLSGGRRLLPTGKDSLYTFRRYINAGDDSFTAVGIVGPFAEHGSPLWLRYDSRTPGFTEIRRRLQSSDPDVKDRARDDEGHVWLPLSVPANVSGATVVETLVDEVKRMTNDLVPT